MGPPTVTQRIDLMEERLGNMEQAMKEGVSKEVAATTETLHHSLTEILMEGQSLTSKRLGADLKSMVERLEGRLIRSREHQESLVNSMKNDQLRFQAEASSQPMHVSTMT